MILNSLIRLPSADILTKSRIVGIIDSPEATRKRIFLMDRTDPNLKILASTVSKPNGTWEIFATSEIDDGNMLIMAFDDSDTYNAQVYDRVSLDEFTYSYVGSAPYELFGRIELVSKDFQSINRVRFPESTGWQCQEYGEDVKGDAKYLLQDKKDFIGIKTFILDIADNYGTNKMGIRSIDFYTPAGVLIPYTGASDPSRDCYASTEYNSNQLVEYAFNTTLSKIGSTTELTWRSANYQNSFQRVSCVFTVPTDIGYIVINNYHYNGTYYNDNGIKNCKIYVSPTEHVSNIYGNLPGDAELIFNGVVFMHISSNEVDDFIVKAPSDFITLLDSALTDISYSSAPENKIGAGSLIELSNEKDTILYQVINKDGIELSLNTSPSLGMFEVSCIKNIFVNDFKCIYGGSQDTQIASLSPKNLSIPFKNDTLNSILVEENKNVLSEDLGFIPSRPGYTTKSVIFEFADNWGAPDYLGIRSIDFYDAENNLIDMVKTTDFLAYKTNSYSSYYVENIFETSKAKDGTWNNTQWLSNAITNQRVVIVFNSVFSFYKIVINNSHSSGTETDTGAKNVKIYISNDAITSTVYNEAIPNSDLIFDGILLEHVNSDIEDPQVPETNPIGSKIKLLIHSNNEDSTITFTDSSFYENTVTINGDIQHSTMEQKIDNSSILFDGIGDCLSVPSSTDFDLGTEDFAIDFWVNLSQVNVAQKFNSRYDSSAGWFIGVDNTNHVQFYCSNGVDITSTATLSIDTWYHIAVSCEYPDIRLFIDGGIDGTQTASTAIIDVDTPLCIGSLSGTSDYFKGYIDEIRFVKEEAIFTEDFTPWLQAYERTTFAIIFYSLSFDNKNTYKIWTGTVWKAIASNLEAIHGDTGSTAWHYINDSSVWTIATADTMESALLSASEFEDNLMDVETLNALTSTEYDATGGFVSADGHFDIGVIFQTDFPTYGATLSKVLINDKFTYNFNPIDLDIGENTLDSYLIGWTAKKTDLFDPDSDMTVLAMVTGDTSWTECVRGEPIPGVTAETDLTDKQLWLQVRTPSLPDDSEIDPAMFELSVKIISA